MSRVSHYVAGPYDGVSRVAASVALPSTCRDMRNCWPYIPHGVLKKPPLDWRGKLPLGEAVSDYALVHEVPRGLDADDQLLVLNWDGSSVVPYLFNFETLAVIPVTVASSEAQAYLDEGSTGRPNQDLRAFSIEDVTFITNRRQVVGTSGTFAPARPYEAIIWAKTGGYARTTTVTVTPQSGSPVTASYETDRGDTAGDALGVGTDRIAKALYDGTVPPGSDATFTGSPLNTLTSQGFTVTLIGHIVYISHPSVNFTLAVSDDAGGSGVVGIKDSVQRFSDLPSAAVNGFTVRIAQEAAGGNSDYFVAFQTTSTTNTGVWTEVVQPGAPLGLDPDTMPVKLYLNGSDWEIDVAEWGQRTTGNATLSPDPDFVGDRIQKTGWWRGRLSLLAENSLYLSSSGDPYVFYLSTLTASLDSDPIGLLPPSDRKAFYRDMLETNQVLVSFANKAQAVADTTAGAVTAAGSENRKLGSTLFNELVPVQEAFSRAYYTAKASDAATGLTVYELALDRISGEIEPENLSVAIPGLLPLTTDRAVTFDEAYTTIYGTSGAATLWVHSYRYAGPERVQNGFCPWDLPVGYALCGLIFRGARLYVFLSEDASGGLCVTSMDLVPLRTDPAPATLLQWLDLKVSSSALSAPSYDAGQDVTTFELPYESASGVIATVRTATDDYPEGFTPEVDGQINDTLNLEGDWTGVDLWFGVPYVSTFTPLTFYARGEDGNALLNGRLSLSALRLDLAPLSEITIEVQVRGKADREVNYNGFTLSTLPNIQQPSNEAEVQRIRVPINGQNSYTTITVSNESHLGFGVLGFEWDGDFNYRSRRTS